jgi:hypothetical protein
MESYQKKESSMTRMSSCDTNDSANDLGERIRLYRDRIITGNEKSFSTYKISGFANAPTKVSAIHQIRIVTSCDYSTALRTFDEGQLICDVSTLEQRLAIETLEELGCTIKPVH